MSKCGRRQNPSECRHDGSGGVLPSALRASWLKSVILLSFLLVPGLWHSHSNGAPNTFTSEFEKSPQVDSYYKDQYQRIAKEQQEKFRKHVAIPDAVGDNVPTAAALREAARQASVDVEAQVGASGQGFLYFGIFLLGGIFFVLRFAPNLLDGIREQLSPWRLTPARTADLSAKVRAEEQAFAEFIAAFQSGPVVQTSGDATPGCKPEAGAALKEFYSSASRFIRAQRNLLQDIINASNKSSRQKMLADLCRDMRAFKGESSLPELLPVWQMASALEGLLKQLSDKSGDVTQSTLRTVTGGMELLDELCKPGLDPELLTRRPLKLLAVDDDLISRKAIALALKRAFNVPDLAEDGEAAFAMANAQVYDVIFLDVQLPGMDGFELCSRIRETTPNRNTPIVFVTCQSDFDARAQSTLSGGNDLIAKPFLTFEITVKALTLALYERLQKRGEIASSGDANESQKISSVAPIDHETSAEKPVSDQNTDRSRASQAFAGQQKLAELRVDHLLPQSDEADPKSRSKEITTEFLTRASEHLEPLRELLRSVFQTEDADTWQQMLADVYLRIHSFTPGVNATAAHPAMQLSSALEGLLRKLLENPTNATPSTMVTVATAVDLLHDLCVSGLKPDMVTNPPIRLLVVDDDPVMRRVMTGALQTVFEKPENAASGETALRLVAEKCFDAVFLDVQMPGMDGLEVCSKIRQAKLNGETPIIFVTGQNDFKTRAKMSACGGNDFVGKPFLTSELTVKALTFALRNRLEKLQTGQPAVPASDQASVAE